MVARATSAQPFLRTLPHTLLRLVPPSAGRPRCAAPPSQLPVSTRSAFFRQVRHEKRRPFAPSLCMVARATSTQSFLRTLPHTLLRLVPPSAGRPRCAAPPSQLSVSTRSAFFRQVRHEKGMPFVSLHGCAGYFGATVSPHAPPHPLAPRAAFGGATALRCSTVPALCFHAQRVLPAGPPRKKHRQSGALSWWTCAGSNRGLTEFVCGHYTFSL